MPEGSSDATLSAGAAPRVNRGAGLTTGRPQSLSILLVDISFPAYLSTNSILTIGGKVRHFERCGRGALTPQRSE